MTDAMRGEVEESDREGQSCMPAQCMYRQAGVCWEVCAVQCMQRAIRCRVRSLPMFNSNLSRGKGYNNT